MKNDFNTRRKFITSAGFGAFAFSIPSFAHPKQNSWAAETSNDPLHARYPSLDDKVISEVVGKSHFDLDRVKEGEKEGFTVRLNRRKILSLGVLGTFGGALYRRGENRFTYNGAPSVEISFLVENGKVHSLTVHEPGQALTAKKVS